MEQSGIHLSSSLEDYLETIYNLISSKQVARSKDIADALNVSRASVTQALRTLSVKELIHYKPYGYVTMTDRGEQMAAKIARRHSILESFFVDILGVDPAQGGDAACRAEHALGATITNRLSQYVEFVGAMRKNGTDLIDKFQDYCTNNQCK